MKKKHGWTAAVLTSVVTAGAVAMGFFYSTNASDAHASAYSLHQMSIELNNQVFSKPKGIYAIDPSTNQYTTYMPIWYVMQALKSMGIQSGWDGSDWNMTLPSGMKAEFNPKAPYKPGSGPVHILIDGVLVQRTLEIVSPDPASHQDTTYVPIWYVGKVLSYFGIHYEWDGSTWNMIYNAASTGQSGSGSGIGNILNGVTNSVGGVLNNTADGGGLLNNAVNSIGNTLNNVTGGTGLSTVTNTAGNLVNGVTNSVTGSSSLLGGPVNSATNTVTSTVNTVIGTTGGLLTTSSNSVGGVSNTTSTTGTVTSAVTNTVTGTTNTVTGVVNTAGFLLGGLR